MTSALLSLRFKTLWWLIGAALVALVVYASLATGGPVMQITVWDKLQHMLAYSTLGLYFSGLVNRRAYPWVLLTLFLMGVILEWLQRQGGVRVFDVTDMLFNGAGLAIAALLAWLGLRHWCRFTERLLA